MRRSLSLLLACLPLLWSIPTLSQTVNEPWHPVREYVIATLTAGEAGTMDVWHPAVDDSMTDIANGLFKMLGRAVLDELLSQHDDPGFKDFVISRTVTEMSREDTFRVTRHPDKLWARVTVSILDEDFPFGVALHGQEWRLVAPLTKDGWSEFDEWADWDSYSPPTPQERMDAWVTFANGWQYGKHSFLKSVIPTFVAEIRRSGSRVSYASFLVTFYDKSGAIIGTGSGSVRDIGDREIKTVVFLVQGDVSAAHSFRIQLDSER